MNKQPKKFRPMTGGEGGQLRYNAENIGMKSSCGRCAMGAIGTIDALRAENEVLKKRVEELENTIGSWSSIANLSGDIFNADWKHPHLKAYIKEKARVINEIANDEYEKLKARAGGKEIEDG